MDAEAETHLSFLSWMSFHPRTELADFYLDSVGHYWITALHLVNIYTVTRETMQSRPNRNCDKVHRLNASISCII